MVPSRVFMWHQFASLIEWLSYFPNQASSQISNIGLIFCLSNKMLDANALSETVASLLVLSTSAKMAPPDACLLFFNTLKLASQTRQPQNCWKHPEKTQPFWLTSSHSSLSHLEGIMGLNSKRLLSLTVQMRLRRLHLENRFLFALFFNLVWSRLCRITQLWEDCWLDLNPWAFGRGRRQECAVERMWKVNHLLD